MQLRWIIIAELLLFAAACNVITKDNTPGMKMDHKKSYPLIALSHRTGMDSTSAMSNMQDTGMGGMHMGNGKAVSMEKGAVQITLTPRQQMLAGIHTSMASLQTFTGQVVLTGTTIFDPQKTRVISAWVSGWIKNLYVRNPGEMIRKGQKLYELYSPELLSAEKDYLLAIRQQGLFQQNAAHLSAGQTDFPATVQAIKQKLLRLGLTELQIDRLPQEELTGKATIYSKVSGYLIEKIKESGDHVTEGEPVLGLAGNDTLWVQAQLYDTELPLMEGHPRLWVEPEAFPGERLSGELLFSNPVNESDSRVHLLNIAIPNPGGRIQPGMPAYVYLEPSSGAPVLTIPASSLLYDAHHDYVWTALSGNRFERHIVKLGGENKHRVWVIQGINPGEMVVSSGAYLVNSEYILKYGSGVNMAGMQMSDMKMQGRGNK